MKHVNIGKKTISLLLTLVMILSIISVTATKVKADATEAGSSWTVNSDGTLSISDTAATKAVGSLTQGNMILIGTKGGAIIEGSLPSGTGIVTKISNDKNAAMIRFTAAKSKDEIIATIKAVRYTELTTQVHIDVTFGETSNTMEDVNNFGVLNADGEAHVYKLIDHESKISWIQAFNDTVNGADTLGGLKGYLATVTTRDEAELVRGFYNSSDGGTWIAGTSLRYSTNSDSDYSSAGQVTPSNYSGISNDASVSGQKITATSGAYYCPFGSSSVSNSSYYNYYYWACGPEQGQTVSKELWASGEPNNSDGNRQGETCIVSPWGGNAAFNDFSPFNNVSKYFLEFSAYAGGLAGDGAAYNSITIYKVTLDGNGATGSIAPMEKFKGESLAIRTDYTGLTVPADNTWFAGWYATRPETDYDRVVTYSTDAPTTLYAHWSQFGYTSQYDPVEKNGLVYDGTSKLLIDTTGGHGVWRVNSPTDGSTNSFTYWYSKNEGSGYEEGSIYDSSKTGNVGYIAGLKTDCTPLYETNAGTYNIYWNWNHEAGSAKKGYVTVTIEPKSITDDSISVTSAPENGKFTYNGEAQAPTITIKDGAIGTGTVLVSGTDYEIKYEGVDPTIYESGTTAPTNVGTYKAIITGKGNYKDSLEIAFTIEKAEVVAPTITEKHYTGENLTADVEESELYNITENEGGIEVGNYDVILTLKDTDNYKWIDSDEADNTLVFKIVPEGTNIVTVNLEDWTYGETANKPTSTATFGNDTVVFSYSSSLNGVYTSEMPKDAGVWYIKANIDATENYGAGEAINHFEIKEANSVASKVTANNRTYDKTKKPLVSVDNSSLFGGKMYYALGKDATNAPDVSSYTTSVPEATDVGTYYVWYKLIGDENYKDIAATSVTVTIEKIQTSVNTEVKKSEGAPDIKVGNLSDELAIKLLTDEEKDEFESGVPVNVYLTIDAVDRSKVPAVDLAVVDKIISDDGYTYGQCLDLSLWKKVGDNEAVQIHDTNGNPITMQITVPDLLRNVPDGYKRTFRIVRVHEGVSTVLAEGEGPTFDISSDKFSSYFIIYKDEKVPEKGNKISTGDKMHIGIVVMVMIDSIMAAFYLTLRRKMKM